MSIPEIGIEVARLTLEQRWKVLAVLIFELTMVGRGTYVPQSEEIAAPRQLRAVNEIQHRVASALAQNMKSGKSEDWIWPVIAEYAAAAGITTDVTRACSQALRSINGSA